MLDKVVFLWLFVSGLYCFFRYRLWNSGVFVPLHSFDVASVVPLRGLMAIMVIFCHLSSKTEGHLDICFSWGEVVVSMFFFISGYGYLKSFISKENYLKSFVFKRIVTIVLPFLICIILYQCVYYCVSSTFPIGGGESLDITDKLLPTSWYIVAILIYSLAFYSIAYLTSKKSVIVISLLLFSIIYYVMIELLGFGAWWNDSILAFNVGTIIAIGEDKIKYILTQYFFMAWICLIFMLGCFYAIIPHYYSVFIGGSVFDGGYYFAVLNALLTFVTFCCFLITGFVKSRFLNYCGRISLYIYLVQGAVIHFLSDAVDNWLLLAVLSIIVSIVIASTMYWITFIMNHKLGEIKSHANGTL